MAKKKKKEGEEKRRKNKSGWILGVRDAHIAAQAKAKKGERGEKRGGKGEEKRKA